MAILGVGGLEDTFEGLVDSPKAPLDQDYSIYKIGSLAPIPALILGAKFKIVMA